MLQPGRYTGAKEGQLSSDFLTRGLHSTLHYLSLSAFLFLSNFYQQDLKQSALNLLKSLSLVIAKLPQLCERFVSEPPERTVRTGDNRLQGELLLHQWINISFTLEHDFLGETLAKLADSDHGGGWLNLRGQGNKLSQGFANGHEKITVVILQREIGQIYLDLD